MMLQPLTLTGVQQHKTWQITMRKNLFSSTTGSHFESKMGLAVIIIIPCVSAVQLKLALISSHTTHRQECRMRQCLLYMISEANSSVFPTDVQQRNNETWQVLDSRHNGTAGPNYVRLQRTAYRHIDFEVETWGKRREGYACRHHCSVRSRLYVEILYTV